MEPSQHCLFIFDNSTGNGAYEDSALLANHIALTLGREAVSLSSSCSKDDARNTVNPTFRENLVRHADSHAPKTVEERADPKRKHGKAPGVFLEGTSTVLEGSDWPCERS